ncbi:MAG: M14 family zinc carboxypeptidase, partial [Bacteroidota bacterium]
GSMGGYHTYAELLVVLDSMKAKYPHLISEKQPIGNYLTIQGRPIYWLKIGVNPNEDEDKPAILYNALHHAREPNSLSQLLFFMWYLLENYETDAEIQYLLNEIELYFIPCINPDGYVYNERTNPNGGGGWRKNRATSNAGDTVGVDLNRNYGLKWGLDNTGSSSDPNSLVYRGPAPFSEPETQAIRDFCIQHEFKMALNYHAFSNLLIIPWGFDNTLTPDDATYRALAEKMTEQNNYTIGTGLETVGYIVNGDSDDWMYGEQTVKPKIFSMTPEVGPASFGFWPPKSAILGLNRDNLWQNITAAGLLKSYGNVIDNNPTILDEMEGTLSFQLQNVGLETGAFTVSVVSKSEALNLLSDPQTFELTSLATQDFTLGYNIAESNELAQTLDFDILISNGQIERRIPISKQFYTTTFETVFSETVAATIPNWQVSSNWGVTNQTFVSADYSITDSPNGNYPNRTSSFIQLIDTIDLTNAAVATVTFNAKWALETNYDFVQLLISTNGVIFTPLCGQFTVQNDFGQPAYNGSQNEWISEEIDLSNYIGAKVFFRFQLDTDDFVQEDGFYFDDFSVNVIDENITTSTTDLLPKEVVNTLSVTPNPFGEFLTVDVELTAKHSWGTLVLVNSLGQRVATKRVENLRKGRQQLIWDLSNLRNGVYFLQLEVEGGQVRSQT